MNEDILKRSGLSGIVTPTWSTNQDIEAYAQAGFGAIGIWMHKLERGYVDGFWIPEKIIPEDVIEATANAVRASSLTVSHLVLTGFYTEPNRERRIEHTLHAMDVAAALGAGCVVVAPGRRNGRSYQETRDFAARALTDVLEQTRQPNVRLALEPIVAWQSDYLNTLGEALDLVELVDHPDLGVFPDSFHLWRTGTLLEDIERAGPRIFGFHLRDGVPDDDHADRLPGEGEIPLREVVRAVEATGYRGTYDSEYMYDPGLIASDPEAFAPEVVVHRVALAMAGVLDGVVSPDFAGSTATD